jgi:hypothetical protein
MKFLSMMICVLFFLVGCVSKNGKGRSVIVENGTSSYSIVIPEKAKPWEQYAAEELSKYIEKMSGAKLPVVVDNSRESEYEFILGASNKRLKSMDIKFDSKKWGVNGFTLKTKDRKIIIAGGNPRGVIYGVLDVLDKWGIRFFNEDITRIPEHKTLILSNLDETVKPSFSIRDISIGNMLDTELWTHLRLTGPNWSGKSLSSKHGRLSYQGSGLHSFLHHIQPQKYFKSHPEYFSMRNGKRVSNAQLCLTNKELPGVIAETLLKSMRKAPGYVKYWGVGQMDNLGFCQCSKCMALAEKEGAQSGPIIDFVNKISEKTSKEFPEKIISTFAYQYGELPPKNLKGRDNVAVQLCTIYADRLHPISADSPIEKNRYYYKALKGWSKQVKQLQIWDYVTDFTDFMAIHPDYFTWGENLRLYKECGADFIFMQGAHNIRHSEFGDLRRYVLSRLMWDVNRDNREVIREYCEGVYGAAAPMVIEYMNVAHETALKSNKDKKLTINTRWDKNKCGFSKEQLKYWIGRFEDAIQKEKEPLIQKQLKLALMPLLYTRITAEKPNLVPSPSGVKPSRKVEADYLNAVERFKDLAKELNIQRLRESAGSVNTLVSEIKNSSTPHSFQELRKGNTKMKLLPGFGGQIKKLEIPALGGKMLNSHESSYGMKHHDPGWSEFYNIISDPSNPGSISMRTSLAKGISLERTVTLLSETSFNLTEKVINSHTEQQKGQTIVFLRFPVSPRAEEQLWTLDKDGKWRKQEWMQGNYQGYMGNRYKKSFAGGGWALQNTKTGLTRIVRFSPEAIGSVQYWSIPLSHEFSIIITSMPRMLDHKQAISTTLNVEYLGKEQSKNLFLK